MPDILQMGIESSYLGRLYFWVLKISEGIGSNISKRSATTREWFAQKPENYKCRIQKVAFTLLDR
eukprot:9918760-Ditylum_brightwellii.AAC.1